MENFLSKKKNDYVVITGKFVDKENDDLLNANPHTGIYKILDTIDEFNNLNKSK